MKINIYKPILLSFVLAGFAGCSSISKIHKIAVPDAVNNEVNIPEKKEVLTEAQKNNWQHFDLATDTIPGMSVYKAYEFLQGKKNVEVVVGVVDSGTDLKHEDLKDVAWINIDEIAGNGIDDDKNGYVDDINGWNFIGKSYKERLEYERILLNPSIVDAETLATVKKYQEKKIKKAREDKLKYQGILANMIFADKIFAEYLGKPTYTIEEVKAVNPATDELKRAVAIAEWVELNGRDIPDITKELKNIIKRTEKTIAGKIDTTDYRIPVGDNVYDINDKSYGDANSGPSKKKESHGSHVSGIIGATRDNGKGMDGVANVKIMAIRSVSEGDEYDKDVALGIRYAVDNGAKVINTSFGKAFSPNKEWVYDAIKYAAKKDVLIVNAAGNDGNNIDIEKTYPNDAPDLINEIADNFLTVGAMSSNYNKLLPAGFSNYGKRNVDIFAPGVQVYSTTPERGYDRKSGTSMASPSTAGVAALIRSYYPKLSASQVKYIIMNSGTCINLEVIRPGSRSEENPDGILVPFSELSVSGRIVNAYSALVMADKMINTQ